MNLMNRGYAGFYKGYYLRSSYEYAYARYLDYNLINWGYEDKEFDIKYKVYKPDFFLYDNHGNLLKIVEIKSRDLKAKEVAIKALKALNSIYKIDIELVSYEELLKLYKEMPVSLTSVITSWVESENTTVNKSAKGALNAHYNLKHSDVTKKKIGEHTKKLWESDSFAKQRMLMGLRNSGLAQKGKIKIPREIRQCQKCGKSYTILISSTQKFCSNTCAGEVAIKLATEAYVIKRSEIHSQIKNFIIVWSKENKDLVRTTKLNKIKTTITPLLHEIERKFGVKDFRSISKAVFGIDKGRKELIRFMKNISK
jgi:hypothetical protein